MMKTILESKEYSATMMPLAYQRISGEEGWLIVGYQVSRTPIKSKSPLGKGKSISALIAKRKASSPGAASSLVEARKRLAGMLPENQTASLKSLRLKKGLSQSDLALLMDTQQSYIAKIEKNGSDLRATTISKLAKVLGVTCDQVIEAIESDQ